jgi:hypothetical protein
VVTANTLLTFERRLDRYWENQDKFYNYRNHHRTGQFRIRFWRNRAGPRGGWLRSTRRGFVSNKNVDIEFSANDAFLGNTRNQKIGCIWEQVSQRPYTDYPKSAKITYALGRRTLVLWIYTSIRNCKFH